MNISRHLIVPILVMTLPGCIVYQHRDTPADDSSTWGKSQIYRMMTNGWFQQNISNRDRDEYSPDVHHHTGRIVFLAGMNKLHVMDSNGDNMFEVAGAPQDTGSPAWSHEKSDDLILFTHPASVANSAVYRISPDGSNMAKITNPAATQSDESVDSLSGKHIVFTRLDTANNYDRDLYVKYIWDNRPEVRLTSTPNVSETQPVVSHDGTMLAYRASFGSGRDDEVHVARFTGATSISVIHTIDLQLPAGINISGIDFSENDQQLFISTQSTDVAGSAIERKKEIFRTNLDGSNQTRLTNNSDQDVYPNAVP